MNTKLDSDKLNLLPVDAELDSEQAAQEEEPSLDVEQILQNLTLDSRRDERVIAFYFVYAVDRFDYTASLESVADNFSRGYNLVVPKTAFAFKLAQGAIDERDVLDEKIKPYLKNWRLERLGCCTLLILRMALWELNLKNSIPSIIINEAVELAKFFAEKDAYKFINGLLDEYCKQTGLTNSDEKIEAI
jgi:N utilization substance protein B